VYNVDDVLTMTNHEQYVVTAKTTLNNKYYYQIVNYNNHLDWMIVYEDGNDLIEELDQKIVDVLAKEFLENK